VHGYGHFADCWHGSLGREKAKSWLTADAS